MCSFKILPFSKAFFSSSSRRQNATASVASGLPRSPIQRLWLLKIMSYFKWKTVRLILYQNTKWPLFSSLYKGQTQRRPDWRPLAGGLRWLKSVARYWSYDLHWPRARPSSSRSFSRRPPRPPSSSRCCCRGCCQNRKWWLQGASFERST